MIKEIILKIEKARIDQGFSETALAKMIEVDQNKVWRFLNGKTKRPDMELINKLQAALNIVSEPPTPYTSGEQVSEETTKSIDTFVHFDSVTQKMLGRVFDRMKDMTEEEQWNYCADQLSKLQKKGE
jgi:transcriptional regulator with XRE-family HTH domain